MFVLQTESMKWEPVTKNPRGGIIVRKFLREAQVSNGIGYTADLVRYEPGEVFTTPRHNHNFDQLRYTISGAPDYGKEMIAPPGAVTFFPAGAYYGPQSMDTVEILLVQWSENWVTREMSDAAYATLEKRGEFRDGYFFGKDADGNETRQDAVNAMWAEALGHQVVNPTPKIPNCVIMNPDAYGWRDVSQGVQARDLGHLTDLDFNPVQYAVEPGGVVDLGDERTHIVWVDSGEVDLGDQILGERSIVFCDQGETLRVKGSSAAVVTIFGMPLPTSS